MNHDDQKNNGSTTESEKSIPQRPKERTIQPLDPNVHDRSATLTPVKENINTATVYPEATKIAHDPNINATQRGAITTLQARTQDTDRLVCMRVKPLLVAGVLFTLSSVYSLVTIIDVAGTSTIGLIFILIGLVQLGMSVYLLLAKDHHGVALVLKIYLIFQLISLFRSVVNPYTLLINVVLVIFIFYTYNRVKSLSYS